MKDSDKKLITSSGIVLIDSAVAIVDAELQKATGIPLALTTCWGLTKALCGGILERRAAKGVEVINFVSENNQTFTVDVLLDEKFQDGLAVFVESYLTERNDSKREVAKKILLGFAQANDKENFPLEKFIHTLTQLSETDIEVLRDCDPGQDGKNYQIYGDNNKRIENIFNLIGEGLLQNTTGSRLGFDGSNSPFVKISLFGKEFFKYVTN